jgi:hypothetical protein
METEDVIYFFGKDNPKFGFLSNFYPCQFNGECVPFASAPIISTDDVEDRIPVNDEQIEEGANEEMLEIASSTETQSESNKDNHKPKLTRSKRKQQKQREIQKQSTERKPSTTYLSAEQCYVHQKILFFDGDNSDLLAELFSSRDSEVAALKVKKLGRRVNNFDESLWASVRFEVMCKIVWMKFSQNVKLKRQLLKTGTKTLYEASPHDAIWGIGYGPADAQMVDPSEYGLNLLGECLMEVRERLRSDAIHVTAGDL